MPSEEGDKGLGDLGELTKQKSLGGGRAGSVGIACERGGGQVISGHERHLQQEDSGGRTGLASDGKTQDVTLLVGGRWVRRRSVELRTLACEATASDGA